MNSYITKPQNPEKSQNPKTQKKIQNPERAKNRKILVIADNSILV
jgi:hypothetical protein